MSEFTKNVNLKSHLPPLNPMPYPTFTSKRFVRLNWKYSSAELAAKVIFNINPNGHSTWQNVLNYIVDLSTRHAIDCVAKNEQLTIYGTGGWYVTFFPTSDPDYSHGVEVTLMPYAVEKYLESQGLM